MPQETVVTKLEASKRWGIAKSTVSLYVNRGMPVRSDGLLDWKAADSWRRSEIVSQRSGSHKSRLRAADAKAAEEPIPDFFEGYRTGYLRAWANIRSLLPKVLGQMPLEGAEDRMHVFCLVDYLLESWGGHLLKDFRWPLDIDWKAFGSGKTPAKAKAFFEGLQSGLRAMTSEPK